MARETEINCGNCGQRNTPSCYGTCEHFARRKARDAAIKAARKVGAAEQYTIDYARRNADRIAKKRK